MTSYHLVVSAFLLVVAAANADPSSCKTGKCSATCWTCKTSTSGANPTALCGSCSVDQFGCSAHNAKCPSGQQCWKCTEVGGPSVTSPFCASCTH